MSSPRSTARAGGRLAGRDAALQTIGAALADALDGAGGLLVVTGEPGIGKSALLAEAAREAVADGLRVVRGVGWQGAGAPPYWLWTQVLRALGAAELGDAQRLLDRAAATPAADAAEAGFRLFEAVRAALAGAGPLLVELDDLQWADDDSVRLLDHLRRTLADERVLIVGACRDEEAGPVLAATLGSAATVPLAGLDAAGVAAVMAVIAGPVPDAELVGVVHARCDGNPLFVRELTRLMVARREWSASAVSLPDGVRETLRLRLARLSQPCVGLLEVAAVAGAEVSPALLAQVGPADLTGVTQLLDEAVAGRVLVAGPDGSRFAHDLYRETVLAAIPARRRAALHHAIGEALVVLSAGGADPTAVGGAARLAAHFVAAGPGAAPEALEWTVAAAEEATARLGHQDAARHYTTALGLLPDADGDAGRRIRLLLRLAAARARAGEGDATRETYLRAADLARRAPDPVAFAAAALGVAGLGARSGTDDPVAVRLLAEAAGITTGADQLAVRSQVLAAFARALRHGSTDDDVDPRAVSAAAQAVELGRASGDPAALAHALHAAHDIAWAPGTGAARLEILAEMATAAAEAGDHDLGAEAVLLRATALVESGDPAGPPELARYTRLAERLGHARGRWGALSRRATLAELSGRVDEAVAASAAARELGDLIGLPDTLGVFATLRGSLAAIGGPRESIDELMPAADPLWPVHPLLRAWGEVHADDLAAAAHSIRGFSERAVRDAYDLEMSAIAAVVFAAVGSTGQREWIYDRLAPRAGVHVVVGGCAAYHGVVDHFLGLLAAALGRTADATRHFTAAIAAHERLGTLAWARLSRDALGRLQPAADGTTFRQVDGMWVLAFAGREVRLPDAKGLHDIATLLASPNRPVHVFTLLGLDAAPAGADPVLDRRALAAYRARLVELDARLDRADATGDRHGAEGAAGERDALLAQLRAASGLGGRSRRLGAETERARKAVTARIRDVVRRIDATHPDLAAHLRATVHTGTSCTYAPDDTQHWQL